MTLQPLVYLILIASVLAGCSSTTKTVESSDVPDEESAYLAGLLSFDWTSTALRLALELECGGVSSFIELDKNPADSRLSLYPVRPGNCVFLGIAPMGGIGDIDSTIRFSDESPLEFSAQPGVVYNLGKVNAAGVGSMHSPNSDFAYEWRVRGNQFRLLFSELPNEHISQQVKVYAPKFSNLEVSSIYPLNKHGQQGRAYSAPLP